MELASIQETPSTTGFLCPAMHQISLANCEMYHHDSCNQNPTINTSAVYVIVCGTHVLCAFCVFKVCIVYVMGSELYNCMQANNFSATHICLCQS